MSILIIGPEEERMIADAIAKAKAKVLPWSVLKAIGDGTPTPLLLLGDRKIGVDEVREQYPPQQLMLGTYRVAFSFEEQPAGTCRHLSVSSHNPKKIPGFEVMSVICEAFSFSKFPPRVGRVWHEEYEPGCLAVNVIEVEPPAQEE